MDTISLFHETLPRVSFAAAETSVNEWRGGCLAAFSGAEAAATNTLAGMSRIAGRGKLVSLPLLVGARFEALATAIGPDGPFREEGARVVAALSRFRAHDRLRVMLCHGVGKVALDSSGKWLIVMRVVTLRSQVLSNDVLALTQDEAAEIRAELKRAAQSLIDRLKRFQAELTTTK